MSLHGSQRADLVHAFLGIPPLACPRGLLLACPIAGHSPPTTTKHAQYLVEGDEKGGKERESVPAAANRYIIFSLEVGDAREW